MPLRLREEISPLETSNKRLMKYDQSLLCRLSRTCLLSETMVCRAL